MLCVVLFVFVLVSAYARSGQKVDQTGTQSGKPHWFHVTSTSLSKTSNCISAREGVFLESAIGTTRPCLNYDVPLKTKCSVSDMQIKYSHVDKKRISFFELRNLGCRRI